jgi:hypothetical protein
MLAQKLAPPLAAVVSRLVATLVGEAPQEAGKTEFAYNALVSGTTTAYELCVALDPMRSVGLKLTPLGLFSLLHAPGTR